MGIENLDKIFRPKSIAVIGASEKKGSIGTILMRNLIESSFAGSIYPINPNHSKIWQRPAFPNVKDIKAPVDLAVVAIPLAAAVPVIRDCVDAGVGGVVIIAAGGKEIGAAGQALEAAIRQAAVGSGLRIIGPNCVGILSSPAEMNASFAHRMPVAGKMAFISQSGAISTAILDLSISENIGFSYFVNLGDMLDVDFGDMIDYCGGDPEVGSIVMYVENLTHVRKFMSAARAVSRVKPIVALKAGRTRAGALAAASHTGAMAGENAVYDAAFQRAGILRVKTFEELFDCAELLSKQPKPEGPGLAIITNAGGPAVMAVDALADYGFDPVTLDEGTIAKLDEILPPFWSKRNPIDMLGDATPDQFREAVTVCLEAKEVEGVLIMTAPQALTDPTEIAVALVDLLRGKRFPIFTSWLGGANVQQGRDIFNRAGIPTFDTPERAVRAFMDIYQYSKNIELLQQIPSRFAKQPQFDRRRAADLIQSNLQPQGTLLTEAESKDLLSAYGIPCNKMELADSSETAVQKAASLGWPVAMKINSRMISHKSDAGCVRLDLKNDNEVAEAFDKIMQNARAYDPAAGSTGVTVQPMLARPDFELILGAKKDPDFGPVILFGMGGIIADVLHDRAIALPPLNRLLARRLMEQTRAYRLLRGYRHIPPANLELLEEIIIRLAQLLTDFSEIRELDINPLHVTQDGICAVDARVVLEPSQTQAPLHLVISPYPDEYEAQVTTSLGVDIFIRPIRPEDAPLLVELFESLSPRSVYMRFFTPLKRLPGSMLARFTQIDYDREIALVAISNADGREKILGVARVISASSQKQAEFAVAVGDQWQGQGIGAELLKRCLQMARQRQIEKVYGLVLAENKQMLSLGQKLGFKIKRLNGTGEYELTIDCRSPF